MTDEHQDRLVVSKDRLRGEFHHLLRALEDYRAFLAQSPGAGNGSAAGDDPAASADDLAQAALALLRRQHLALLRARVWPGSAELALALLQQVLAHLPVETLRFRRRAGARGGGDGPAPASEPDGASAAPSAEAAEAAAVPADGDASNLPAASDAEALREALAALQTAAEAAPLELHGKLQRTLGGVQELFAALADAQGDGLARAMARINLATANAQMRGLLREIAIVTRDVYRALQSVSDELPLDALSQSSGGISQAVQRLNSVVVRLDDAATQNLDQLERVTRIGREESAAMGATLETLREAQRRLMTLKEQHPHLAPALEDLQDRLSDQVGAPVMTLQHLLDGAAQQHLELISNQSFQELTSRTLKKIIDFVQSLEVELGDLLHQYQPAGAPEGAASAPSGEPAEARETSTQDDVDQLLGELGF